MKWYEEKFVNHRDWILDHLDLLQIGTTEAMLVMLIDFMNQYQVPITMNELAKKLHLTEDEIDRSVSVLCAKKYLEIKASKQGVFWSLAGLFEADMAREANILDSSLIDVFESEFGRPLNPNEMEKISEWNRTTEKKLIFYALREASIYQKLSIPYIDKILKTWKEEGKTVQRIESELEK